MENTQAFPAMEYDITAGQRYHYGMNLRDYFAGQALTGIVSSYLNENAGGGTPYGHAVFAYDLADAMLKERRSMENEITKCELCGSKVKVVGHTTKHYEPVDNMENEIREDYINRWSEVSKGLEIEHSIAEKIANFIHVEVQTFAKKKLEEKEREWNCNHCGTQRCYADELEEQLAEKDKDIVNYKKYIDDLENDQIDDARTLEECGNQINCLKQQLEAKKAKNKRLFNNCKDKIQEVKNMISKSEHPLIDNSNYLDTRKANKILTELYNAIKQAVGK